MTQTQLMRCDHCRLDFERAPNIFEIEPRARMRCPVCSRKLRVKGHARSYQHQFREKVVMPTCPRCSGPVNRGAIRKMTKSEYLSERHEALEAARVERRYRCRMKCGQPEFTLEGSSVQRAQDHRTGAGA